MHLIVFAFWVDRLSWIRIVDIVPFNFKHTYLIFRGKIVIAAHNPGARIGKSSAGAGRASRFRRGSDGVTLPWSESEQNPKLFIYLFFRGEREIEREEMRFVFFYSGK